MLLINQSIRLMMVPVQRNANANAERARFQALRLSVQSRRRGGLRSVLRTLDLRNGAGARLEGPQAIIAYYEALKGRIARVMEVQAVIAGENALCAALHSRFEILSPEEDFAGEKLTRGDAVLLDSIALYEVDAGRFTRIEAASLARRIIRLGEA
jgi:hypothetical protein